MRKIREVLRLSALGLAQHQIARSCSMVQSTVHKYLNLADAAQLHCVLWPTREESRNPGRLQILSRTRNGIGQHAIYIFDLFGTLARRIGQAS